MSLSVLVEPIATGFRASITSPLSISAEGPTEVEAMANFTQLLDWQKNRDRPISESGPIDIFQMLQLTRDMRANPMFEEFMTSIDEYRQIANAVPGDDD